MSITVLEEHLLRISRLTDEQAETIRQAASCAKDLEARLTEEQKRASQLEEQMQAFRAEAIQAAQQADTRISDLEARLAEEQKLASQLEEQMQSFRAEAIQAAHQADARVNDLEARLAEEKNRSAQLTHRITDLEPVAACAERLGKALGEIARLAANPM
jgi:chromosome segregation ATPase